MLSLLWRSLHDLKCVGIYYIHAGSTIWLPLTSGQPIRLMLTHFVEHQRSDCSDFGIIFIFVTDCDTGPRFLVNTSSKVGVLPGSALHISFDNCTPPFRLPIQQPLQLYGERVFAINNVWPLVSGFREHSLHLVRGLQRTNMQSRH